jgi:hypothetical protein
MTEAPEGPDLEAAHIEYITGDRAIDKVYETIRDVEQDPIGALMAIQQLVAEVARFDKIDWREMFLSVHDRMRKAGESKEMGARWFSEAAHAALSHREDDQ